MKITKKQVEYEFNQVEGRLNICWSILIELKRNEFRNDNFVVRLIQFQDILAFSIFRLYTLRQRIITEIKNHKEKSSNYSPSWLEKKLLTLENQKKGIDSVVSICKALGDAYAYFFYQFDLDKLADHTMHPQITNYTAGIGELGELEFIKGIKHIDGYFTLFHGITNILRYGDFSFIDLKTLKAKKIGELKTKKIDSTLKLSLFIIEKNEKGFKKNRSYEPTKPTKDKEPSKQLKGIFDFIKGNLNENSIRKTFTHNSYWKEIDNVVQNTKSNNCNSIRASDALVFACIKPQKTTLYKRTLMNKSQKGFKKIQEQATDIAKSILCKTSQTNGLLLSMLLYNPDMTAKDTPGTVPIFWHPISEDILRQIYFLDCYIMTFFNPAHLIQKVEQLGFIVESHYSPKKEIDKSKFNKIIQRFDLFYSYIIHYLMTEDFVIDSVKQIDDVPHNNKNTFVTIKPVQQIITLQKQPSR